MPYKYDADARIRMRRYHMRNRERILIRQRDYYHSLKSRLKRSKLEVRGRALINKHRNVPCLDCGVLTPGGMEFDHVRGEKCRSIGSMYGQAPATILAEIAKCEVVCRACHLKRTAQRRQHSGRPIKYSPVSSGHDVSSQLSFYD